MLPIHQIESFLQHTLPHLQEIVLEVRNIIAFASRFNPRSIAQ